MTTKTLRQLEKIYGDFFVEIKDKKSAMDQLICKMADCWMAGYRIDDTQWIHLAVSSGTGRLTRFVCKDSLIGYEEKSND